ncbi:MAG TPA: hypothetical protein VHM26_04975, partial [Chitinophagaceae bacterium]|nr:hypothetical protein [Chitinophagaceae bacterium]
MALIILLVYLAIKELSVFLPGLLGALTLYILSRANYFQLVYHRKWKKGRAAGLFILYFLLILGVPIFLSITLISPKVNAFLSDPQSMIDSARHSVDTIQERLGFKFLSQESLNNSLNKLTAFIPTILNSTATLITNL